MTKNDASQSRASKPGAAKSRFPVLKTVAGVLVARPPTSSHGDRPAEAERARLRREQRETVVELVSAYAPDAVVCVGVPFGHTRPQWILPYGGRITLDGATQTVHAQY